MATNSYAGGGGKVGLAALAVSVGLLSCSNVNDQPLKLPLREPRVVIRKSAR